MTSNLRAFPRFFGLVLAIHALIWPSGTHGQETKAPTPTAEAMHFFETKVRPVLANSCFRCHGPEKQKGHLRADSRAALITGGELGPAIVPGNLEKSLLVKAIRHDDPELKMPPTGKLTREQIDDLTRWVKMGAPWPGSEKDPAPKIVRKGEKEITDKDREHWSFKSVKLPSVPTVKNSAWVANPIDAFIATKLDSKGFAPNPPATKIELLRRLTFNLTGLPPSPQEIEAFVKDTSPRAYENAVDKLLASPRYGEKWARHWLDLVRYAETNSYERDNPKPHVWRYRDYVIRSFNDDKPYNQFIREQLAGDEMPNAGPDQFIATGFYRLGIWDDEPSDRQQARYDGLDDIVATVSQGILGLTMDCARCHDHKIDPILHRDYYRMMAFFHNVNHFRNGGPTDEVPIYNSPAAKLALAEEMKRLEKRRDEIQGKILAIEKDFQKLNNKKGSDAPAKADMEDLKYRFYRDAWMKLPNFDALKHEDAGTLPKGYFDIGPRTRNDTFGFVFEGTLIVPADGAYTFYLDSDDGSRLLLAGNKILEHDGIHGVGQEKEVQLDLKAGRQPIRLEFFQNVNGYGLYTAWSGPGFTRRLLSTLPNEKNASGDFNQAFKKDGPKTLGKERFKEYQALVKELEAIKNPAMAAAQERALCVSEAGTKAPETFVFIRGNPGVNGPKVEPGFPVVLGFKDPQIPEPIKGSRSTGRRTALADWITAPANPLTARVIVNRIWQQHFGRGIVRSPNNFGSQGDRPTHPELLDWLTADFVEHGWSIKHLQRMIVSSNAYKMSSHGQAAALKTDPQNDLFWRFDMRRLSAEEIRDAVLAVSGNLNVAMFGPGIYPEIPREVLAGQSVPGRGWGKSSPEDQARRSVYVHVKRSLLLPILDSFDLAETDRSAPTRFASTQPTQALLMLNSGFINKQAEIFADRLRREAPDDLPRQIRLGLNLATSRTPTAAEVTRGLDLVNALARDEGVAPATALRYFCLMALNLNEFMYLD